MRDLAFTKYEGLGNDFVVVDASDEAAISPAEARRICDRRFGVGGDGVLLVLPSSVGVSRMRVINADGSVPEMCGNGLRCVAVHVARARGLREGQLDFETDAGPRRCWIDDSDGRGSVTVDMGMVQIHGDRAVSFAGEERLVAVADAGNPHAIMFGQFSRADVDRIGPQIATHAAFPKGTNVEFATLNGAAIDLVVWERGVGVTLACGTGACATVAVASAKGLVPRGAPVTVNLPGGALEITIDSQSDATKARVIMRGPARQVFAGTTQIG
jgi:diaminopimelate epimerase